MGDFYRVLKVFWAPSQTLSDAAHRPFVIIPLLVPTVFAAITSLVVYFKFPPADAALRTVWFIGLVSATLGPLLIALAVSSFFFGVFSLIGRKKTLRCFSLGDGTGICPDSLSPSGPRRHPLVVERAVAAGIEPPVVGGTGGRVGTDLRRHWHGGCVLDLGSRVADPRLPVPRIPAIPSSQPVGRDRGMVGVCGHPYRAGRHGRLLRSITTVCAVACEKRRWRMWCMQGRKRAVCEQGEVEKRSDP